MPSSPDPLASAVDAHLGAQLGAAVRWQPADLVEASVAVADRLALFELDTTSTIPPELLEPARKAAEAAGYAAGWAIGMRASQHEAAAEVAARREQAEIDRRTDRAQLSRALDVLALAATSLEQRTAPAVADLETFLLSAAFDIAEAVVGATLRDDATRGVRAMQRAIALVPQGDTVTVRLHPADHATVVTATEVGPGVVLVADPELAPGDCVATSGATTVDARIRTGLDRVRALLAGETPA